MSLSPGTRLGHYDVTALIGEGGMGQVYQATDTQLNRQVRLILSWRQALSDGSQEGRPLSGGPHAA
jgi:serine/threonine protein kinase